MRVLAISSYGVLGGAELALSAFLAHRPAHVRPRVLLVDDGPLRARLHAEGVPAAAAHGYTGRPGPQELARFTRALHAELAQAPADVVWAVGSKAALLAVAACRARRVPLVWHKVDFSHDARLARPLALASDGVMATSHAVVQALGALRRRRLLGVVGVPITLPETLRADADPRPPVVGTLARLVPYKGHHHLIEATSLLSSEFPDVRLVLAGAPVREYPDYPEALRRRAADLGLGDRVELPGHVADPGAVLRRLSVFVNATYRDADGFGLESLGAGLVEASWAGVPAVAPRLGGTPEAVRDGETGTLVDSVEPDALAAAIAPYLRDAGLRARTGEAGRAFARAGFRPQAAAGRLFGLLERAAA